MNSSAQNFLWPYEDTQLEFEGALLRWRAPWLQVSQPTALPIGAQVRALGLVASGPQEAEDLHFLHGLASPCADLPLFYHLPRRELGADHNLTGSGEAPAPQRWDVTQILGISECGPKLTDPLSLLSALRRLHLRDVVELTRDVHTFALLRSIPRRNWKTALGHVVRQNHYVTERCQAALTPALGLHQGARPRIEAFLREERGHDRLLASSLDELGRRPSEWPVLPATVHLMDVFESSAGRNLVAFAFLVDMFERTPASGRNPVVEALLEIGHKEAALPLQKHAAINARGGHHQEAMEILAAAGAIPESCAREAVALAETASDALVQFVRERAEHVRALCAA